MSGVDTTDGVMFLSGDVLLAGMACASVYTSSAKLESWGVAHLPFPSPVSVLVAELVLELVPEDKLVLELAVGPVEGV